MNDFMNDPGVEITTRWNVPRVFMAIPTQESVDILIKNINNASPGIRHSVIRVLNRLRVKHPDIVFDKQQIYTALKEEAKSYYEIFRVLHLCTQNGASESEKSDVHLLEKALNERLIKDKERMFWLLSLVYPPKDIYNSYIGASSNNKTLRASGIEFLENILHKDIKEYFMPIVDKASDEDVIIKSKRIFEIEIKDKTDGLKRLINRKDSWLQSCAIYSADITASPELKELVESAKRDRSLVVRETAELVLKLNK